MTSNANNESINITENAEPVNQEGSSVDSSAVQLGDEVCFNITEEGTVIIGKPVAGVGQALEADAQQKYVFNMSSDEITSAAADGDDLVVTFDNGSTVTLENYVREFASAEETLNFINGEVITLSSLLEEEPAVEALEEPQVELRQAVVETDQTPEDVVQELAQTEPAAGEELVAEALAEIEPAAGDAGAGAAGNSGYGFESSFNPQGIISIEDVGPIGPTALEYGITQPSDDLFIEEQAEELPPLNPNVEFNNVQVLEDGSVQLLIDAAPVTDAGILTFTITGIPSDWTVTTTDGTYDAGTGTWTFTTTSGAPFNGGPVLSPPADSDVDLPNLSITVREDDPATERTGTFTGEIDVIVDAVADAPDVDGLDDSGFEGETLDMDIPTALTGEEVNNGGIGTDDGSESITNIIIEAITPGVDLNDYQITNVNGPVTLDANGNIVLNDRSELDSLQIKANDPDFVGSIDFKVTLNTQENPNDLEFNGTNDTNQATDTFTVTWKPTANPPEVEVTAVDGGTENGYVYEDNIVEMNVTGTLDANGSGNEILTLTVTGIDLTKLDGFSASNGPDGETWNRVTGSTDDNASFTITLNNGGANYAGIFTFTPDAQSDLDLTGMEVVASAYEPSTDTTANSAPDVFDVYVDAVADDLDLQVSNDSGAENATLDIQVSNVFTGEELIDRAGGDTNDGSEEIINIVLSSTADLENDFTVVNDNGNVTFDSNGNIVFTDKSDLNGLKITPKDSNFSGTIEVDVTLNTAETQLNGVDFDDTNNTATDTETVKLTWDPVINPPSIIVNGGVDNAHVKEDFSVDVPVHAELGANASDTETLTIRIDGINLERLEDGEAGFNATGQDGKNWVRVDDGSDDSNASYEISFDAGVTEYNGTLTFDPVDQSDLDITGMTATVTATDTVTTSTGTQEISATDSDDFNVIVDAVADKPDVTAADNSGEEGDSLAVDIDGMLGVDRDSSENITGYEVRGDQTEMNDFTFTVNGTERAPVNGVISLSVAEVDALVVTPKDSSWTGDLTLNAYVLNAEGATVGAGEYDGSDNTNSDHDPFTLTWTDDDEPIIAKPDEVTVDETNFTGTPRETSDSGDVSVEFGDDYNGATITGNGQYDIGGATSNGDAIDVTFDAATNTYTGSAGTGADVRDVFTLTIDPANIDATDGSASSGYTFTLLDTIDHPVDGPTAADHNDALDFTFGFNATDSDGDVANDTITVNVLDDGPKANNDVNNFQAEDAQKDYNIVLVLDVSGSMAGSKLALLKSSVANLLQDYNDYNGGDVKVHIVPFANSDQTSATYTVTSDSDLNAAIDFVNGMSANGTTNYEAPMQSAIDWLQGASSNDPISGAETYTYFLSDGEPNRYVNQSGNDVSGSAGQVMNEISGSDGSNEIALLQNLSAEVTGVGIGVNSTTLARLAQIGTGGKVLDVQDANDLYDALSNDNPVKGSTSGNVITGDNGGAGAADDLSEDRDTTVTKIGFGSNEEDIAANGSATIDGAYGTLTINSDGSYTYKLTNASTNANALQEVFDYVITDGDGDTALATLTINITIPDDQPVDLQAEALVVDESDFAPGSGEDVDSGTVTADFGNDGPGTFEVGNAADVTFSGAKDGKLTSNGVDIEITTVGNSYVGKAAGETIFTLDLNETTGDYDFTLTGQIDHADASNPNDAIDLAFDVIAKDDSGDTLGGKINVKVYDDAPVAQDDINAFQVEQVGKDFNIVMVLDVSGSMAGNQLALLKSSVSNLLQDYGAYNGGDVKVHLVPFASSAQAAATYTVTNGAELDAAKSFVNGLSANGFTNYEAPMQSAIDWLQGNSSNDPISGAETYAYFVSDGEPNRYIDSNGNVESGDAGYVMGEISGSDGSNEIQTLKDLTTEVVGVGIGVNSTTLARLSEIGDGAALDVQDANDLYASLSAINPIKGSADGNVITGENGGAGAEDALSQDADTLVTDVDGNAVNVGSETVVEGTYGYLTIEANGDYSYELKQDIDISTSKSLNLDPNSGDVAGDDASITKNGITITGFDKHGNQSDLRWLDTSVGNGIGVIGTGDNKVYPYGESLEIGFEAANSVEISIGELGSNDETGKGIDYIVHFADGTSEAGEYGFVQSEIVNGVTSFTLSSSDYGNKLITGVDIESTNDGHYNGSSFLLNDVTVNYEGSENIVDTFTYTITDADGDTSTADLTLYGNQQGTTAGNDDLVGNDSDNFLYGGAGDDIIYGEAGDDVLVGGAGDDTLIGGEGADTFVFTNNGDADTIRDFDASEGDALDISDVLSGFDALSDSLDDFVFTASNGSNTEVHVDTSGSGDQAAATLLVTLEGVDVTLADLTQSGSGTIIV